MIIKKKNISSKKNSDSTVQKPKKSSIIKKDDADLIIQPKGNQIIDKDQQFDKKAYEKDEFEKIDISSIEFQERVERRRGDRRRGYRRIDERSLVSRAQQEAHTIKELAAKEGYKSGLKEAQEEIYKLKNVLDEFLSSRDEMYESFYPHIMEISLAVVKKIIKKETELSEEILKSVVTDVIGELNQDTQKVEVRVNSKDSEFAKVSLPEIFESTNAAIKITVTSDDSIEQGSCVLYANNGVIDANFTTQLTVLQNAFGIYKGGM